MSQNLDPMGRLFQPHNIVTGLFTQCHYKSYYSTLLGKLRQNVPQDLNQDARN